MITLGFLIVPMLLSLLGFFVLAWILFANIFGSIPCFKDFLSAACLNAFLVLVTPNIEADLIFSFWAFLWCEYNGLLFLNFTCFAIFVSSSVLGSIGMNIPFFSYFSFSVFSSFFLFYRLKISHNN